MNMWTLFASEFQDPSSITSSQVCKNFNTYGFILILYIIMKMRKMLMVIKISEYIHTHIYIYIYI